MTAEEEARVATLEQQVLALKAGQDAILAILEAGADPVAASFRRFQQDADRQMGRG